MSSAAASFPLYMHNGFKLEQFTKFMEGRNDFVVQDHHSYFVFTPSDAALPASEHTDDIESAVSDSLAKASNRTRRNLIVGEWSCALTEGSLSSAADKQEARRDFCTEQMEVYSNTTAGWAFWCMSIQDHLVSPIS